MSKTIVAIGTVTIASKAKKLLFREGVMARLVKSEGDIASGGCSYGLEIDEADLYTAIRILRKHEISGYIRNL